MSGLRKQKAYGSAYIKDGLQVTESTRLIRRGRQMGLWRFSMFWLASAYELTHKLGPTGLSNCKSPLTIWIKNHSIPAHDVTRQWSRPISWELVKLDSFVTVDYLFLSSIVQVVLSGIPKSLCSELLTPHGRFRIRRHGNPSPISFFALLLTLPTNADKQHFQAMEWMNSNCRRH